MARQNITDTAWVEVATGVTDVKILFCQEAEAKRQTIFDVHIGGSSPALDTTDIFSIEMKNEPTISWNDTLSAATNVYVKARSYDGWVQVL